MDPLAGLQSDQGQDSDYEFVGLATGELKNCIILCLNILVQVYFHKLQATGTF